jgi:transcription antitermination factor NusG
MAEPLKFDATDFDAYAPSKWSSNVYNLERLRVKEKLDTLGKQLSPELKPAEGSPLTWETSVEHPALWNNHQVKMQALYLLRSADARNELSSRVTRARSITNLLDNPSPYREHIHLAVSLDHEGIEIALQLPPEAVVDHKNLIRKMENHWELSKLQELLSDLPSTFSLQVCGLSTTPAHQIDVQQVISALKTSRTEKPAGQNPVLRLSTCLKRDDPQLTSTDLLESIRNAFETLMPLYEFIAWRRENDYLEVQKQIAEEKQKALSKGLSRGDRVRIIGGLWSGKQGSVQSTDARGKLKVLVGKITVTLEADEVVPV